ncbi:MAG: hypothetical protein AAGA35_01910 [Patescibacteria group bacterium]
MPPEHNESAKQHARLEELLRENQRLLTENNELVRRMHRNMMLGFWLRIVWYGLLIGLPFALYFYVLEPYFTALGSNYEVFSAGIQEIPGWKQVNELFHSSFNGGE